MQPISQNNPNLYRGPASSQEFNQLRNELHYDISNLFNAANMNDTVIKQNMDLLIRENFFLQHKIAQLESVVAMIKQDMLYKQQGIPQQKAIKSFYSMKDLLLFTNSKAKIDTLYGVASIQEADQVTKTGYKDERGNLVMPSSFQVSVLESNNTQPVDTTTGKLAYYKVDDQALISAFDKDNNTVWMHTSSFPEKMNVTEVYGIVHIQLPLDVMNNAYTNTITLNPYPEYSMTIMDIQYKSYGDQWFRLPNYPTEIVDGASVPTPVAIADASKLIFSFPRSEITELQIFFKQPYWFSNNGKREFVYGFQDIGIEYRVYNQTVAEFVTEFSLEGTTKRFSLIDKPTVTPAITTNQNIGGLVEHSVYYTKDLSDKRDFGVNILAPIQKVYVKTTIKSEGDIIPFIKEVHLNYTYKDIADL